MALPKEIDANYMVRLAADHSAWFTRIIKPLLAEWMEHGYKHGFKDGSGFDDTAHESKSSEKDLVLDEAGIILFIKSILSNPTHFTWHTTDECFAVKSVCNPDRVTREVYTWLSRRERECSD